MAAAGRAENAPRQFPGCTEYLDSGKASAIPVAYSCNLGAPAAELEFPNPPPVVHPTVFISIGCWKPKADILNVPTVTAVNFKRNTLPVRLIHAHKAPQASQICPVLLESPSFSPRDAAQGQRKDLGRSQTNNGAAENAPAPPTDEEGAPGPMHLGILERTAKADGGLRPRPQRLPSPRQTHA